MAKILVVGGAGYVGSSTVAWLIDHGHKIWVFDNLATGHRELALGEGLTVASVGDRGALKDLFSHQHFDCVMHFAAKSLVGESVQKPQEYFENNVLQTRVLLEAMRDAGIKNFVFSSTCAIFGDPGERRIDETLPKNPLSPYGETKLEVEKMMEEFALKHDLRSIALRYFNASGAEPKLRVGEWHEPETHLIPRILKSALDDEPIYVFGTDYPTPDGTCIRDYIYVWDLAAAHAAAMNRVLSYKKGSFEGFNLGSEKGYSVREVIRSAEKITDKKLKVIEAERRAGDPPRLVADSSLARKELGFNVSAGSLDTIVETAWKVGEQTPEDETMKAVFLDRDGTINVDPGYLSHRDQVTLIPGAGEALALLKKAGYLLIVVSNQSGVARGLINPSEIGPIHDKMNKLLAPCGAKIDDFAICTHHPDEACACRKPKPKLLLDAAKRHGIDLSLSYMVGDRPSDLGAGRAAGCRGVALVRTGEGSEHEASLKPGEADFVGDSLMRIADWILSQEA